MPGIPVAPSVMWALESQAPSPTRPRTVSDEARAEDSVVSGATDPCGLAGRAFSR